MLTDRQEIAVHYKDFNNLP